MHLIEPPKSVPGIHRVPVPPPGRRPVSLPSRREYVTREGDTLSNIASMFYGNRFDWPRIYNANQRIGNPNNIHPGMTLQIP